MTKRRWFLGLGLAVAALAGMSMISSDSDAEPRRRRPFRPAHAPSVSVTVVDHDGSALRTFSHDGRTFVLGERGERYAVRVHNHSSRRVETVVSVDGRDAISGRSADFSDDRGYVIPAHDSVTIEGFRTSLDEVAAFRFADPSESYSAQLGTPENVGVIGVAVFGEVDREPVEIARPNKKRRSPPRASASPGAAESKAADRARSGGRDEGESQRQGGKGNLGTEFGEARSSSVVTVSFERSSSRPTRVIEVRYDDARGLEARGIDVFVDHGWRRASDEPVAFPGGRFARPPRRH